ncbi:restriction endonuclease, partial [Spirosoma terrae]
KMVNDCGLEREIDVYIETTDKKIVIECKDWRHKKNSIKIDLIDAFYGKTSLLPSIDRRIFVARGRYQSGAKILADYLGIELCTLDKIDKNTVLNWLDISQAKKMRVNWVLVQTSLIVEHNGQKVLILNVESNTDLYVEGQGNFTLGYIIKNNIVAYYEDEENLCLEMYGKGHLNFWQEKFFPVEGKHIIYSYNGQNFKVFSLRCVCVYELESYSVEDHNNWDYKDGIRQDSIAQAVNITFKDNLDQKYHLIRNSDTGEENMFLEEIINDKIVQTPLIGRDYTFKE